MADEPKQSHMIPVEIEAEMKKSYLDYAMSVIVARAIPDVRDGLKPVQRRILVAMNDLGLASNRGYRKCAKICGDTSGNYHPHGEAVIYPTLVRLAQSFNMRYPLIDGQGNYGSVDGDPPAAMRYTEARLAKITEEILADLEKETVDFIPNFDQTREEPVVLPSKIPNLLVNGASGIAVGMATNIPPHNLGEIIDATVMLIDKPDTPLKEVMKVVPGPDFPTGGYISGAEGILAAYKTGRGSFTMRAKAAIESVGKDRENIVITEIPYQVNKSRLIERIAELVQTKKIEGISDVRDESDRDGMRVVIEIKRGEEPKLILNHLYKLTQMQESFGMILLSIVGGQPRELGLVPMLKLFIDHRVEVVRRRTQFELRKAEAREHILVGYHISLDHVDNVIKIIRGSSSRANARENLHDFFENKEVKILTAGNKTETLKGIKLDRKKYGLLDVGFGATQAGAGIGLSYVQIDAILELQLHRLTRLSVDEILKELAEIRALIAELKEILASEKKLKAVIVKELREVQKDYADPRRTEIVENVEEIKLEDLIADVDMAITVSHAGYIKRTPVDVYRHQSRGGKGRIGAKTRDEDFVEYLFVASAHSYILLFSSKGRVYWLKVYEIPEAAAATRGKAISNLVKFQEDEHLTAVVAARNLEEEGTFIFFATRNATVKKTALNEFSNPRSTGIIAINLEPGRRADRRAPHRRQADDFPRQPRRPGHPVPRNRSALDGPQRRRRERHGPRQGRLPRGHGTRAARLRNHQEGSEVGHAESRRNRERGDQGFSHLADADGFREGLRQAHAARRVPHHLARRQGRHQPEIHRPQRPGGRGAASDRGIRRHDHHRIRQGDPRSRQRNPRSGPLDAGRAPAAPRRRGQNRRRRIDPGRARSRGRKEVGRHGANKIK